MSTISPRIWNYGLNGLAGAPIEWTVELSNGTVLTESVTWTLQQ